MTDTPRTKLEVMTNGVSPDIQVVNAFLHVLKVA